MNQTLYQINNESAHLGGQYFDQNNITQLNTSASPYNQDKSFFDQKKNETLTLLNEKATAELIVSYINGNITLIDQDITNIELNINSSQANTDQLMNEISQINTQVNSVGNLFSSLQNNATIVFDDIVNFATHTYNAFISLTDCGTIGDFIRTDLGNNLCVECLSYSIIILFACFAIGTLMFCLYPVILEAIKRICNPINYQKFGE